MANAPTASDAMTHCPCDSERPRAACHEPILTEFYRASRSEPIRYDLPGHVNPNQSRFVADRVSLETSYAVESTEGQWQLQPRNSSVSSFVLLPLVRPTVSPNVRATADAFAGVGGWPDDAVSDEQRHEAEQTFIRTAVRWTPDDLHKVREAFVTLLKYPSPAALQAGLEEIIRTIHTAFPNATVDVLRMHRRTLSDPILIRILAMMPHMEVQRMVEILQEPITDPYARSAFNPEAYFELLTNVSFPRVFGFGMRLGAEVYVIVDYGEDVTVEPVELNERRARDIGATLFTAANLTTRVRAFPSMRHADRHFLRAWITRRLNYLFSHLTNLGASVTERGTIDPMPLWKDLLTVKDIVALTQLLVTSADPTIIRLLFFDLLDRYCELGGSPKRHIETILSDSYITGVADTIGEDLLDLRPVLRDYLLESWRRYQDGIWSGVLDREARDSRTVNLAGPKATPEIVGGADFVSQISGVLRNTTHGYHLRRDAFEKFLVRHNGLLPDSVRELAIAFWMCLLACPHRFWPNADRFSGMDRFQREPPPGWGITDAVVASDG